MKIKTIDIIDFVTFCKFTVTGHPGDPMVPVLSHAVPVVRREKERVPTQSQGIPEEIVPGPPHPLEVVAQAIVQVSISSRDTLFKNK